MTETTTYQPVEDLSGDALDAQPLDRDWSEGYPEHWDYIQAPDCQCGSYARWISGEDLAERLGLADAVERDWVSESWSAWRCEDPDCEHVGEEIDPHEGGAEGPMMNYAYPVPRPLDHDDADAIRHLPLCIVTPGDEGARYGGDDYYLALTGGGMDLSWEICEAFMTLGFLPPVHYCDLPGMAGKDYASERNAWIIAGCIRACELHVERATNRARFALEKLRGFQGDTPTHG